MQAQQPKCFIKQVFKIQIVFRNQIEFQTFQIVDLDYEH